MLGRLRELVDRVRGAQGEDAKPFLRQVADITNLRLRRHLSAAEYYVFELHRKGTTSRDMARYIPGTWYWNEIVPTLNQREWVPILSNKWLFHKHFEGILPLPDLLGILHPANGTATGGQALRSGADLFEFLGENPAGGIVLKPVSGSMGTGVIVVTEVAGGRLRTNAGTLGAGDLDDLIAQPGFAGLLVEEKLSSHPFFTQINPYTETTMRIVTLVDDRGGVTIPFTTARFGRAGGMVDNTGQGGIAAAIDTETGVITMAQTKLAGALVTISTHPDSGVPIPTEPIPQWEAILEVCRQAARSIPGLKSVGWDVLLTAEGPKIIEGNHDWDVIFQQRSLPNLTRADVMGILEENGLRYSPDRLPSLGGGR